MINGSEIREQTGTGGPRILLAAGGTGGHIMPAVALAEALRELAPEVQIQFCCGSRPSEVQLYRRLGLSPWVLPVAHHRRGLIERGRFMGKMLASWSRARQLLKQHPVQAAVGFGGYLSVPPLLAARLGGAKLILHEQNARLSVANRILAPFSQLIALALPVSERVFLGPRTQIVGNPVRQDIVRGVSRQDARTFFRLRPDRLVCLCLGGSQGAAGINQIMLELLQRLHEGEGPAARWQMLWSTGPAHFEQVTRAAQSIGLDPSEHVINPFIDRMAMAYAAADLVIARAGALSIAELTALGRPAVLVPLPTSAGGHQASNARGLVRAGAAEMILETDPEAARKMEAMLGEWASAPEKLEAMAEASRAQGRPEAAREMARLVLEVVLNRVSE